MRRGANDFVQPVATAIGHHDHVSESTGNERDMISYDNRS
jgi:hypothetical protein